MKSANVIKIKNIHHYSYYKDKYGIEMIYIYITTLYLYLSRGATFESCSQNVICINFSYVCCTFI